MSPFFNRLGREEPKKLVYKTLITYRINIDKAFFSEEKVARSAG